jgi:hypothetical protein
MRVATFLNIHANPELVMDTVESIQAHMTNDILLVIDGASNAFVDVKLPAPYIKGFKHGFPRAPYRNVALGLKHLTEMYDSDWYCYMDYDALVASDRFKHNLKMADEQNIWMLGNDGAVNEVKIPIVEAIIGKKITKGYYLLGCMLFFNRKFIDRLKEIKFLDRFLNATNSFSQGFMPGYDGYDVSEHMYPTLAREMGGNIGVFATYTPGRWHGSYEYFPCRFRPELTEAEDFPNASILHPLKDFNNPIRVKHRNKRKERNEK